MKKKAKSLSNIYLPVNTRASQFETDLNRLCEGPTPAQRYSKINQIFHTLRPEEQNLIEERRRFSEPALRHGFHE